MGNGFYILFRSPKSLLTDDFRVMGIDNVGRTFPTLEQAQERMAQLHKEFYYDCFIVQSLDGENLLQHDSRLHI